MSPLQQNNLEWIRLFLAVQVLVVHIGDHLGCEIPEIIKHFPGVPGFFFVSGLLIYSSYVSSSGKGYFRNRFLRIFPGLLFVTIGSTAVLLFGGGAELIQQPMILVVWFLSQITIGQAYNPELFRGIGVGVINGALWTITVELVFYALVPLIVFAEKRFQKIVLILFFLCLALYLGGPSLLDSPVFRDKSAYAVLATLTPLPWGWMFCSGILCAKFISEIKLHVRHMWLGIVPILLMIVLGGDDPLTWSHGNRVGVLYYLFYVCFILFVAFGLPYRRLSFDFSYGVYIWHMPVINLLLIANIDQPALAAIVTFGFAAISWFLIEKPALKLKYWTMRPI